MTEQSKIIRAFVAIHLPLEIRSRVEQAQRELKSLAPEKAVKWIPPEQIHLTLKFLGGVPVESLETLREKIRHACEPIEPFELCARGLGCFPSARNMRIIWIGFAGDLDGLRNLQERIESETASWREREEREFHPHLTLGRVQALRSREGAGLRAKIETASDLEAGSWRVSEVDLMQSWLSPSGSIYSCLATFPLSETVNR